MAKGFNDMIFNEMIFITPPILGFYDYPSCHSCIFGFFTSVSTTVQVCRNVCWPKDVLFHLGLEFQFTEVLVDLFSSLLAASGLFDTLSL